MANPTEENCKLLDVPIEECGMDMDAINQTRQMGFSTLREITECGKNLIERRYFTYKWLANVADLLRQNNLLHLFQPVKGKNLF